MLLHQQNIPGYLCFFLLFLRLLYCMFKPVSFYLSVYVTIFIFFLLLFSISSHFPLRVFYNRLFVLKQSYFFFSLLLLFFFDDRERNQSVVVKLSLWENDQRGKRNSTIKERMKLWAALSWKGELKIDDLTSLGRTVPTLVCVL